MRTRRKPQRRTTVRNVNQQNAMSRRPQLYVLTYHYIRDLPRTRFPRIQGMMLEDFRQQVKSLANFFEIATLQSALEFLSGKYRPRRNLCLLTFDDGLREHYSEVTPILTEHRIQGVFFVISSCLEDGVVAPVHMNHFLIAGLGFEQYRAAFMEAVRALGATEWAKTDANTEVAQRTYPLDIAEVSKFKYLFNFVLPPGIRDLTVNHLFQEYIGDEGVFAEELYLSWAEAREMQTAGMVLGGHSHRHNPLARLKERDLEQDLEKCWALMRTNLNSQELWPFSYPYGKGDSFNENVVATLRRLGFCCSLCTESGPNLPGVDLFAIHRVDCTQILAQDAPALTK